MAKKFLTVHVTQEDIEKGVRTDPSQCAIACAIRREHPEAADNIRVGGALIHVNGVPYSHHSRSEQFICDFDRGYPVEPSTFRFRSVWGD